mmetsp:Transcript_46318/g.100611  ORF Transcript_46318/g.100611 Transcript_46318/m.100611 type:complete len:209 (-) Transcript_46318:688-1314(-)
MLAHLSVLVAALSAPGHLFDFAIATLASPPSEWYTLTLQASSGCSGSSSLTGGSEEIGLSGATSSSCSSSSASSSSSSPASGLGGLVHRPILRTPGAKWHQFSASSISLADLASYSSSRTMGGASPSSPSNSSSGLNFPAGTNTVAAAIRAICARSSDASAPGKGGKQFTGASRLPVKYFLMVVHATTCCGSTSGRRVKAAEVLLATK